MTRVIADFCRKNHIRKLSLFGSVLREDFTDASDIDVLVEFELDKTPGFGFFEIQEQLAHILGRHVDLHTPKSLSKYFRDEVLVEARVLYEQA